MQLESPRSSRPLNAAWLGGVCAGLADHLGWSVQVLRILFVVLASTRLVGVGLYLLLWLVMPRAHGHRAAPGIEAASRTGRRSSVPAAFRPVEWGVLGALALLGLPPGAQVDLVEAVLATGTPTVLVIVSGRPYAVGAFAPRCAAIVQAFMPG